MLQYQNSIETDSTEAKTISGKVILYNDNCHTFDQVVSQVKLAIRCNEETAFYHTYTAHNTGKTLLYIGDISECEAVSSILQLINLKSEILTDF